jgi:glycosyltransferase involved in cell wall biosynthesis
MNVLVGIQEGGHNGIDVYAEQAAAAARRAGANVTLAAATPEALRASADRLDDDAIRLLDLELTPPSTLTETAQRLWHGIRMRRLGAAFDRALTRLGERFDIIHLNHPGLAARASAHASVVSVAAWFCPHSLTGRMAETWRHTRGALPRRLVINLKSIAFYLSDERGYRAADLICCPTATLATQLEAQGRSAIECPPPVHVPTALSPVGHDHATWRLLLCCGDLSHPRKNIADGLAAIGLLPASVGPIEIDVVGRNGSSVEHATRDYGDHLTATFHGAMPPDQLHALMARSDLLVLPSLYEEWGYVAVESLLCGARVVTYPVHPFADMLADGLGFVASDRSTEALAQAIERGLNASRDDGVPDRARARFGADAIGTRLIASWESRLDGGAETLAMTSEVMS